MIMILFTNTPLDRINATVVGSKNAKENAGADEATEEATEETEEAAAEEAEPAKDEE